MSDLVARLRWRATKLDGPGWLMPNCVVDLREAADKIEELTADRDAMDEQRVFNYELAQSLQAKVEKLESMQVWLFNQGYGYGHHDTVEACYTDLHQWDMGTYHSDIVADLIAEKALQEDKD